MERKSPTTLRYQSELCDRPLTTEITHEISLPDYQPEIKRLLRVSATAQPPARYLGGGSAEFSGTVDFNILYAAGDGKLYCFPTSADYTLRTPMEADASFDLSDALSCYCLCEPDMTGGRVLGPRRMSVRCRLRARVRAYATTTVEQAWSAEPSQAPQRLTHEIATAVTHSGSSAPTTLTDEIIPERDSAADDWRIISATTAVLPEEITTATDTVHCRGQAVLRLLMQRDNDPDAAPIPHTRKLPFSIDIPIEGTSAGAEASVHGCCTELRLTMEDGRVLCEAEIVLSAITQQEQTLAYTTDVCCIGQHAQCEMQSLRAPRPLRCINANFTQNETLSPEDAAIPATTDILDVSTTVLPDSIKTTCENGRCIISGTCRHSLVLGGEDVSTREIELPFRYTCDLPQKADTPLQDCDCTVSIISTRARTDNQRLSIDTELYVTARLWSMSAFSPVVAVTLSDAPSPLAAGRTICYPAPDETLWSVAKRYCTDINTLLHKNHLPGAPRADAPDSLRGVHMIVI